MHVYLCELLIIAVQAVLVESGFIIQSSTVLKAHDTVTKLLQWCGNPAHHPALCSFSLELGCLHMSYTPMRYYKPYALWYPWSSYNCTCMNQGSPSEPLDDYQHLTSKSHVCMTVRGKAVLKDPNNIVLDSLKLWGITYQL